MNQERIEKLGLYQATSNISRIHYVRDEARMQSRYRTFKAQNRKKGLSIIILNLNKPELIIPLLSDLSLKKDSFLKKGLAFEVLVGDTGSKDSKVLAMYAKLEEQPENQIESTRWFKVVKDLKYHFSKNNNDVAFEVSTTDTLLFCNNDVRFDEENTDQVFDYYNMFNSRDDVGVLGTYLLFENKTIQHAGVEFFRKPEIRGLCYHPYSREKMDVDRFSKCTIVPAVTGACLMTSSELFEKVGGLDPIYDAECQDIAYNLDCAKLGKKAAMVNLGTVYHLENATRPKGEENWTDRQHFLRRYGAFIEARYLS